MKKTKKILIIMSLIVIFLSLIMQNSYCIDPNIYEPKSTNTAVGTDTLENIANRIIGPIRLIGSVASVIILIVIGIKYMVGSVEEKAEYKKTMLPYVIGAVMVFGITNLLGILVNIIGGIK